MIKKVRLSKAKFFVLLAAVLFSSLLLYCGGEESGDNGGNENNNLAPAILAPTTLTAEALSPIGIRLTWTDNSDNEDGFKIGRRTSDTTAFTEIATVGANITTYDDSGLTPGTQYYYQVQAYNSSVSSDNSNEATISTSAAAFPGFNFAVSEGTFWDFKWNHSELSGFGSYSYSTGDAFQIRLGSPIDIGGIAAYQVLMFGNLGSYIPTPRWKYLAVSDYKILGSEDGTTLETIFDGLLGYWVGGGFFITFADNALVRASNGSINNSFISGPAISVGNSSSSNDCTYVEGYGSICGGGGSDNFSHFEYYRENVGPIGYYYHYSYSDYYSQSSHSEYIGLVASSLRGETSSLFVPETEPNEYPASKQTLILSGTSGEISVTGDIFVGDYASTVTSTTGIIRTTSASDIPELTFSHVYPQRISTGAYSLDIEDFYAFTAPHGNSITINLKYSNASDLDMDLLNDTGTSSTGLIMAMGSGSEGDLSITTSLTSGNQYLIGISAITTPARTAYTLTITY